MTIIFFSGNLHKAREIKAIFADTEVRIYTEFMEKFEVVESGASFAENAKIKLNALKNAIESRGFEAIFGSEMKRENIILMAEDSGICVESLDNLPNIFSARFAKLPPLPLKNGESLAIHSADSSDKDNIARLIRELQARGLGESKASFVSCVACYKLGNLNNLSLRGSEADEAIQKNNQCDSTESRPLRGAKNRFQTSSSASADFLLEAEKRGTPPKSEKRQLLARRGSGAGGAALLRKETNKSNWQSGKSSTDSHLQNCDSGNLDSRDLDCFGESSDSPRNDEVVVDSCDLDSSLYTLHFAQNDGFEKIAKFNQILTTHGFLNGKVICEMRGDNGFGYDPIFVPNGFDKTLAELPSEVKNALSHRRNALDLMEKLLK